MTISTVSCPICGDGNLHPKVSLNDVEYKGTHGSINTHYSICDACGSEQANAQDMRTNKRELMAFRKQVDGLLSGAEIRAIRDRLGINQAEAARIFGGGPVAFSKYENDDVAQSEAMDKLLRVADATSAAFSWLAHAAGESSIAKRAQMEGFQRWQASTRQLRYPPVQMEQFSTRESQTSIITMHSPANDTNYRNGMELVG